VGKPRLKSIKKAGRLAGVAKGIFKKVASKLKLAKSLPNKGVRKVVAKQAKKATKSFLREPRRIPGNAGAYRPHLAERVPPYGTKGVKTSGVVDLGGRRVVALDSGYGGPASLLPKPRRGMDGNLVSHVEANAVASMRHSGVKEATLYINKVPCSYDRGGSPGGCAVMLGRMLLPGEKLTVYGPNGYVKVFTGQ
jgi:hypothetical protein